MKLMHISDLHIGKKLFETSMLEDQRYILNRILDLLDDERPDAVLIAGDVYDRANPTADAMELLDEFLSALALRGICTMIRQSRFARTAGICQTLFREPKYPHFPGV